MKKSPHILTLDAILFVIVMIKVIFVRRYGVEGSTLTFGSVGHGFESEQRLFSNNGASAFSKVRSLASCSLDDSVCRLL